MRRSFTKFYVRLMLAQRNVTDVLDEVYISTVDKEVHINAQTGRRAMGELIEQRRQLMKSPDYVPRSDFVSLLLEDEVFNSSIDLMIDECSTFMIASTQTTAMQLFFAVYYLVKYPDYLKRVREEVTRELNTSDLSKLSEEQWNNLLEEDGFGGCKLLA